MAPLALGALAAIAASVLFSAGLYVQSLEARTIPTEHALRLSLIARLLGRRRWVLGGILMVVGFGFHVGALLLAPLTLVQPSLAAGLVVLLVAGARIDGQPVLPREVLAVIAISAGVVGLTLASSERHTLSADAVRLTLALSPLGALALLPYGLARAGRAGSLAATIGAGAAYALTGLTTKLVSDRLADADWLGAALWLAVTVAAAGLALLDQTTALQRRGPVQVGVVIYVMPVIVPVVLAPTVLGLGWASSATDGVLLALSVAAICAGAAALAASPHVSTFDGTSPGSG